MLQQDALTTVNKTEGIFALIFGGDSADTHHGHGAPPWAEEISRLFGELRKAVATAFRQPESKRRRI